MNQHNRKPGRQSSTLAPAPTPTLTLTLALTLASLTTDHCSLTTFCGPAAKTHCETVKPLNPTRFSSLQVKPRPCTAPVPQYTFPNQQKTNPLAGQSKDQRFPSTAAVLSLPVL